MDGFEEGLKRSDVNKNEGSEQNVMLKCGFFLGGGGVKVGTRL